MFLTNNSEQTPLDLLRKLAGLGIHGLTAANFITSAMATARFVATQKPHGTAFVIGGGRRSSPLAVASRSTSASTPGS